MTSEAYAQSQVRLEAPRRSFRLHRNNVGVLKDESGRPVRFGLANDSRQLNEVLKSSDLIGWRPVLITPEHVGRTIAQFVSIECKAPGWIYRGTDREKAQKQWLDLVNQDGGLGFFSTGTIPP
jgi:hypothetical protein